MPASDWPICNDAIILRAVGWLVVWLRLFQASLSYHHGTLEGAQNM